MSGFVIQKNLVPGFSQTNRKPTCPTRVNREFLGANGFIEDFRGSSLECGAIPTYNTTPSLNISPQHGKYFDCTGTSDYVTYDTPVDSTEYTFWAVLRPRSSTNSFPLSCRTTAGTVGFEILAGGGGVSGRLAARCRGSSATNYSSGNVTMSSENNWCLAVGRVTTFNTSIYVFEEDGTYGTSNVSSTVGTISASQSWKLNRRGTTSDYVGEVALHGYIPVALSEERIKALAKDFYAYFFEPALPTRYSIAAATATAAITGTATASINETDIKTTGGKTIIITLTGDTFKAAGTGPIGSTADTQALINNIDSAQAEANGWDAVVKAGLSTTDVARTSSTVATITLPAFASYDITAQETITVTVPTDVLVTGAGAITGSPTFTVDAVAAGTTVTKLAGHGGLAGLGGLAGRHGGLAG